MSSPMCDVLINDQSEEDGEYHHEYDFVYDQTATIVAKKKTGAKKAATEILSTL